MTERRLEHHKYSQCFVREVADGAFEFWSYRTMVIRATPEIHNLGNRYGLECTGTYSATTRKQIGWFLAEYFGDVSYYDMKRIAATGEILRHCIRRHAKHW